MAIYQRFYYYYKKQEKQYWVAKKKSAEQAVKRQILNKILEDNDKGIKIDNLNLEQLNKKKGRKVIPVERAVILKNVKVEEKEEKVKEEDEVKEEKPIKQIRAKKAKKEEQ